MVGANKTTGLVVLDIGLTSGLKESEAKASGNLSYFLNQAPLRSDTAGFTRKNPGPAAAALVLGNRISY